ncbi:hypothetical protein ACHAO9_007095 [Fusarium lateritium]
MPDCTLCGVPITERFQRQWLEEFRVVWIESYDWSRTRISGVGIWHDDDNHGEVPEDPEKRHNDRSSRSRRRVDVIMTPSDPAMCTRNGVTNPWGYGFHASCWDILSKHSTADLGLLLTTCVSKTKSRDDLLDWEPDYWEHDYWEHDNWGHDYRGATSLMETDAIPIYDGYVPDLEGIPDEFRYDPCHIPSLDKAIIEAGRLRSDVYSSRLTPGEESLSKDTFSRLPPELLQLIAIILPTSDMYALRLASPAFAILELPERFWASRFQPGREFDYVFETSDHPVESWRALYSSLNIWAPAIPNISNRERVWQLVKDLQETPSWVSGVPFAGFSSGT